jgi:glycosyltransferase involved in cell wall biosynthesis
MKILMVNPILPYPPDQGTRAVTWSLLRALSQGNQVTLLCRTLGRTDVENLEPVRSVCHRLEAVPAPSRRSVLHRAAYKLAYTARGLLSGVPPQAFYDYPGAMIARGRALELEEGYDAVLVGYWSGYRLARRLRSGVRILLAHDVEHEVLEAARRVAMPRLARVRLWFEHYRMKRVELIAINEFTHVFALTDRDRDAWRRLAAHLGKERVQTLDPPLETERFRPPSGPRARERILFLGYLRAGFNRDALDFLLEEVLPRIRAVRPTARLSVVGGERPAASRYDREEIDWEGFVPDVRPHLAGASVLVLPLRFGGGLRVRLLEALAMETPVVSTRVGAAGSGLSAGEHYLEADDPVAIARAVMRLLDEPQEARRLAAAGRRYVLERYGKDVASRRARTVLERAVEEGGARAGAERAREPA